MLFCLSFLCVIVWALVAGTVVAAERLKFMRFDMYPKFPLVDAVVRFVLFDMHPSWFL